MALTSCSAHGVDLNAYILARVALNVGQNRAIKGSDQYDPDHEANAASADLLVTDDGPFLDTYNSIPDQPFAVESFSAFVERLCIGGLSRHVMRMASREIHRWQREHRIKPPVTLLALRSPLEGWLVRSDGWQLPSHFPCVYPTIESAQRAADDVLINYRPHDCRQCGCGEWTVVP